MPRVRPVLAAVLLVVASATAVVAVSGDAAAPVEPADDPVVGTSENSTRVLLLTEADAASFHEPDANVASTLSTGHETLSVEQKLKGVRARLDAAESDEQRREVVANATDWARDRLRTLQDRERTAREQFADGELTATEFALELARIHSNASKLIEVVGSGTTSGGGTLYQLAFEYGLDTEELSRVRVQLVALEGPVRERIAEVVHGERDAVRVHVTTGNGLMLSTMDGEEYLRETYRSDNLVSEVAGYGDPTENVATAYPWVANNSRNDQYTLAGQLAVIYSTNTPHSQLDVWINTATKRVYLERQAVELAGLPTEVEASASANNTTLQASRTYAGGPLLVRVENATGVGVGAPVSLNGTVVGDTGADGELWLLSPSGEYTVSTETAAGTPLEVNVTARPAPA
ncbi:DUF7096 domain-containing protein [Halobacterium yunchengense]|uniref:DUF7096 domain-containing protein n=1 Tax=Halobacterium yunchengense TaxID=3108497 RepID=UPI00300AFDF3